GPHRKFRFASPACVAASLSRVSSWAYALLPSPSMTASFRKPGEPISHELEAPAIKAIDSSASPSFLTHEARRLKHLEVPSRSRPRMLEDGRYVTSRH